MTKKWAMQTLSTGERDHFPLVVFKRKSHAVVRLVQCQVSVSGDLDVTPVGIVAVRDVPDPAP